jgi:uncharacterized repeat protein (TIGR01451 family)
MVLLQNHLVGKPIYALTIVNSGGLVLQMVIIESSLPAGLNYTSTAVISGTPSALSQAHYTVTGTNSSGTGNTTINIDVVRDLKSNNYH